MREVVRLPVGQEEEGGRDDAARLGDRQIRKEM